MKKFQFRLDPLLKIRHFQEQLKFLELSKVLGVIEKNQNIINQSEAQSTQLLKEASQSSRDGIFHMDYLRATHSYLMNLTVKKNNAHQVIDSLQDELRQKQEAANQARMARRILEKLKENRFSQHQYELLKKENAQIDEFNQK